MPVIVRPEHFGLWLGEEGPGAARLMVPARETLLVAEPADGDSAAGRKRGIAWFRKGSVTSERDRVVRTINTARPEHHPGVHDFKALRIARVEPRKDI